MYKRLKDLQKDKKGFTLVELIVVLVILAILMAVLIPALLGWIDKARNSEITTNANAALVAAQGLADEAYGTDVATSKLQSYCDVSAIKELTDIEASFTRTITFGTATTSKPKLAYKITGFTYTQDGKTATWDSSTGSWDVD